MRANSWALEASWDESSNRIRWIGFRAKVGEVVGTGEIATCLGGRDGGQRP